MSEELNEDKGMRGVVCTAGLFKPLVEKLKENERKGKELSAKIRKDFADAKKMCDIHDCELPPDYDSSFSKSWFENKVIIVYGNCPKCMREVQTALVNDKWKKCGVPANLVTATFGNYVTRGNDGMIQALSDVKQQMTKKGFLILRGTWGTGKTHLAVAALKQVGGEMITQADLVGLLRQTYSDNSGPEDLVKKYRECECLVLDELDSQVKGADIPQLLYRILAHRYDDGKFTIITSNEKLDVILEILGPKLTDRIKDNYLVVQFDWKSYRGQ